MAARRLLILLSCLASVALLTARAMADCDKGCDVGWTRSGSRCFKIFGEKKTWTDAENSCLGLGAHLASVHSAAENTFLVELIFKAIGSHSSTWIGGSDAAREGQWLWADGTAWDFTLWSYAQPDGSNAENYIEMNYNGHLWNDAKNNHGMPYICSKNAGQT